MCITCKGQILGLIQACVVNRLSRFCKILSPQTENRDLTTRHWFLSPGYDVPLLIGRANPLAPRDS